MKLSKFNEIGRSMVEMLGVLAIIGVLSVGAIAGYSKAMNKYKINGFTNAYSHLFGNILEHYESLTKLDNNTRIVQILKKMNAIPNDMTNDTIFVYDKYFNSKANPFIRNGKISLDIYLNQDSAQGLFHTDLCKIMYQHIAIPYRENIVSAFIYKGDNVYGSRWKGNKDCQQDDKCLKNMTLNDIETTCKECQKDDNCMLNISF